MNNERGIHRTVSNHVLNYIPLTPDRPQMSEWPLGFMTERCKDDYGQIRRDLKKTEDSDFTSSELEVSGRLFPWKKEIDDQVRKEIDKKKWVLENNLSESRQRHPTFYPPLVIRSKSGFGKSILIGKIISELVDVKFSSPFDSEWPIFDRIVYSQLKDQSATDLEMAVCNGMDLFHKRANLDLFFECTNEVKNGEKIILIDSLDEHPKAKDWWEMSLRFSEKGWRVIWACRDPDWNYLGLGKGKEAIYVPSDKNIKPHWDRFTGLTWDLDMPPKREQSLEQNSNVDWSEDDEKNKKFLTYAYSTTQLMHMFYTNLRLMEEPRKELDSLLVTTLIESRDKVVQENREVTKTAEIENFNDMMWYNQFFDSNLAKIIIQTSIEYLVKIESKNLNKVQTDDYRSNINLAWNLICKRFFQEHSQNRKQGQLSERVINLDTGDIISLETNTNLTILQAVKLKEYVNVLLDYFHAFGLLRESDGDKKFRHRDFAVIAYVEGSPTKLYALDKSDTIFSYFFPHPSHHVNSSAQDNDERIEDFLRRTGNVTSQIDALWNLREIKPDLHKIAVDSIDKFLMKPRAELPDNKGISSLQKKAIELRRGESAIVLHGVPGSGKTFSGVERILFRQANQYKKGTRDSYALIVSLNDELAKSIKEELNGQHKNSPFLTSFRREEKDEIIKTIDVKSIKQILEEWMPLKNNDKDSEWLVSDDDLWIMFETLRARPGISLEERVFRDLQEDYQNFMFDRYTGMFLDASKYLEQSCAKHLGREVLEKWHDVVRLNRENGKLPLHEACAFLRNQLLYYEFKKSYGSKFNEDYKRSSDVIEFNPELSFDIFQNKFQSGFYDCIMVDEVQDLPVIAVNMLSFLSPSRQRNRFILSGDKYQTLNGQNFDWAWFLRELTKITNQLIQDHPDFIFNGIHHVTGLKWNEEELDKVIKNKLDENFRNHPDISALTMHCWKNWPSSDYYDKSNENESYRFERMKTKFKRQDSKEFTPIMVVESSSRTDFIEKIETVLASISARSGVSLLCSNQNLRDYVRGLMKKNKSTKLAVETFDPWTIKGLERNAVVILGGYSVSPRGVDTQDIFDVDFSRRFKWKDFDKNQRKSIDLLRRKMLVSHTRAVEQLIILNTPFDERIALGSEFETIKSVNTMNFSEMEKICQLKKVEKASELSGQLIEFFKSSKIKDIHISIKRISEGLKLKNRSKSESGKTDYSNYMLSLRNILQSDVQQSDLRRLLSDLTGNEKSSDMVDHQLIKDLMLLDSSELSYHSKFKGENFEDGNYTNDYEMMVYGASFLQDYATGAWSKKGFEVLELVLTKYQVLQSNISTLRDEFDRDYLETEFSSLLDDINRVLSEIESLIDNFGRLNNLPSSIYNLGNYLLPYLISTDNQLRFGSYPSHGLKDPEFGTRIIQNLQDRTFGVNHIGEITLVLGKDTELTLDGDVWIKLLNDMIKIKQELDNISFLNFSSKLVDEYASIQKELKNGLVSADSDKQRLIDHGTALSIGNLMDVGQRSEIDKFRLEILEFINKEFIGMKTTEVKKLLDDISAKKRDWINDYITDNIVKSWKKIENFVIFADLLSGMTGQRQYEARAVKLYNESGHVRTWINDSLSSEEPVFETASRLNSKVSKKYPYLKMMYQFAKELGRSNTSGARLRNQDLENFTDLQIFRQALEVSGSRFEGTFDDEKDDSNSSKKGEKALYQLWGFVNKLTYNTLTRLRESDQLGNIQSNLIEQIIESLDNFKLNHNTMQPKSEKDFLRNLLYLQSLCEDQIAINEELQNYPSLQKLDAFNLDRVTDYPQFFADFSTDKEEQIWRDGNKNKVFYPKQKDPLSQLILVGEVLENLEFHQELDELLSGFYHPDSVTPSGGADIYWNNDGFGKILRFGDWIARNKEFQEFLDNGAETEPDSIVLLDNFDLDSRLNKYMDVIRAIHKVLLKRLTPRSGADLPKTSSPKEFMRDVILELFNLKEKAKQSRPNGGNVKFTIGVFSKGSLTIDVAQKGKISLTKVGDFLKPHDFVRLVYDLIGFNGSGKLNIEDSIENIKYHIELFNQYLNRNKNEIAEVLEIKGRQDNFIVDDTMNEVFRGSSQTEIPPIEEPMAEQGVSSDIEPEKEAPFIFEDELEDNLEDFNFEDLPDRTPPTELGVSFDSEPKEEPNMSEDNPVMKQFGLSVNAWERLSQEDKQKLRDVFKNL